MEVGEEDLPGNSRLVPRRGHLHGRALQAGRKLTFFHGASLPDPADLFNSSLEGKTRRAIDIHEDDAIDEAAFKELICAAVAFNVAKRTKQDAS